MCRPGEGPIAWSFFNPLLMLAIYTVVFSSIFKARWGAGEDSKLDFAILLFVGTIVHGLFAECVNRAPSLILSNVNFVKKVVFPLGILPWVAFGSAVFHASISVLVLVLAQLAFRQQVPWTVVFFPFVLVPLVLTTMGMSWFLAALGMYIRDIGQMVGVFTTSLLFLSPVLYPTSAVPPSFRRWIELNPLTFIIRGRARVRVRATPRRAYGGVGGRGWPRAGSSDLRECLPECRW